MTGALPFTTDDLTIASTPSQEAPGRFVLRVPDGWQQGRGAFGGLVLGALARAIEVTEPDPSRALRAFTGEIAGPVLVGDAAIEITELRRGSGLSSWNAILTQEGQPLARASAVLAKSRTPGPASLHIPPPSIPSFAEVPVTPLEQAPFVPAFSKHMEFRVSGAFPFTGAKEPVAEGWIRAKRTPPKLGGPEIVALADAWWPAGLTSATAPRPAGTVMFCLQVLLPDTPLDPGSPLFHRGRLIAEHGGFMAEARELWTADGRLVALNQQTIAWIR